MEEPGEIISLSAMISGEAYEVTAETVGPCLVNLVEREGLLRFMERSGDLGLRSALAVSRELQSAYRDINDFVLVRSSSGKLARLLLSWIGSNAEPAEGRIQTRLRTKRWRRGLAPLVKPPAERTAKKRLDKT